MGLTGFESSESRISYFIVREVKQSTLDSLEGYVDFFQSINTTFNYVFSHKRTSSEDMGAGLAIGLLPHTSSSTSLQPSTFALHHGMQTIITYLHAIKRRLSIKGIPHPHLYQGQRREVVRPRIDILTLKLKVVAYL